MDVDGRRWTPSGWKQKPVKQEVSYDDEDSFQRSVEKLNKLPPLVTPQEIVNLKNELREVALGNAFLLQGGDCAELFDYCEQGNIEAKVKLLLQMSLVLIYGAKKKVVRVARMAGQFAKPRSSPMEMVNGVTMPSFRGDILNSYEADPVARKPDPARLVDAYFHSAATLNYLRASIASGLADLHSPLDWSLGHVLDPDLRNRYSKIVESITNALEMMQVIGVNTTGDPTKTVQLFTSHEGLLLEYEQALTRLCRHPPNYSSPSQSPHYYHQINGVPTQPKSPTSPTSPKHNRKISLPTKLHPHHSPSASLSHRHHTSQQAYYDTSAHLLWIGDRTRQLTHGHVEFFRGVSNPIGIKIGPSMPAADLIPLLDILNPHHEVGKIILITRYGYDKISQHLPAHIKAVQSHPQHRGTVVWQCDPMHGNGRNATVTIPSSPTADGGPATKATTIKTRRFSDILSELRQALTIHASLGSYLGGVHLELTGDAVTECVGGASGLTEDDLRLNYTTYCDPRLNEKQALELAFLVAGFYRGEDHHVFQESDEESE